jgi:hypothetical protein
MRGLFIQREVFRGIQREMGLWGDLASGDVEFSKLLLQIGLLGLVLLKFLAQ